jgi:hypothetical protein
MSGDTQAGLPEDHDAHCLWAGLIDRMDAWRGDWRTFVDDGEATSAVADVFAPLTKSDRVIFEAFAVALLSGNTRWDRIARVRHELKDPFQDFDPEKFAALSDDEIERSIVPWFHKRKAGAASLAAGLSRLRLTAARLSARGDARTSAQVYLRDAFAASDGTPEGLAVTLGTSKTWKLPGFGIALAAEALRMLGLDLCKPDRHILRAMASWSLVNFRRWDRRGDFTPPKPNVHELCATMLAVRAIAEANSASVSYTNSVIWTAGAVSGARMTNEEFEAIAQRCGASGRGQRNP